jgi:O-antigen ligase
MVYGLCLLLLLAAVMQLGSKSVMLSAFLIGALFPFLASNSSLRTPLIKATCVLFLAALLVITGTSSFRTRYVSWFREDLAHNAINSQIPEPRITRWEEAWQLFVQSPLFGHGSGSEKRLLNERYFAHHLFISYLNELNAHNQYMSFAIKTGIWGVAVYGVTLALAFAAAFRRRDVLFASFLVIITIVSFSENILDVNKGIFFYAAFFSILFMNGEENAKCKSEL